MVLCFAVVVLFALCGRAQVTDATWTVSVDGRRMTGTEGVLVQPGQPVAPDQPEVPPRVPGR